NLDLDEGNLKSRIRYCLKVGGFEIGHAPGANQPGIDEFYQRGTRLYVIAQLRIWPANQHQIKVLETGFAKAVFDPGTHGCNVTKICIDQFRGHKQFVAWYRGLTDCFTHGVFIAVFLGGINVAVTVVDGHGHHVGGFFTGYGPGAQPNLWDLDTGDTGAGQREVWNRRSHNAPSSCCVPAVLSRCSSM